jgi:hypothetical protein
VVDIGARSRLYSCRDCDQRVVVTLGGKGQATPRISGWKQPRFGELLISKESQDVSASSESGLSGSKK